MEHAEANLKLDTASLRRSGDEVWDEYDHVIKPLAERTGVKLTGVGGSRNEDRCGGSADLGRTLGAEGVQYPGAGVELHRAADIARGRESLAHMMTGLDAACNGLATDGEVARFEIVPREKFAALAPARSVARGKRTVSWLVDGPGCSASELDVSCPGVLDAGSSVGPYELVEPEMYSPRTCAAGKGDENWLTGESEEIRFELSISMHSGRTFQRFRAARLGCQLHGPR